VKILLEASAEVDRKDKDGKTPLWYAIKSGNENLLQAPASLTRGGRYHANWIQQHIPVILLSYNSSDTHKNVGGRIMAGVTDEADSEGVNGMSTSTSKTAVLFLLYTRFLCRSG
jgi:hypothetical protein